MSYKILALDGGGIRGMFTARILQRLEEVHPFLSTIDLFAGTSTGGILALGLASDFIPAEMVEMYKANATRIFPSGTWTSIEQLIGPKYSNDGLRATLATKFGARRLGELKRDVFVTTYSCLARTPLDMTRQSDAYLPLVECALRTSAAPVYFPPIDGDFIDGGMTANNPAEAAYAWVQSMRNGLLRRLVGADERIRVLSLGTGNANRPPLHVHPWGAVEWMKNGLLDLMLAGPSERSTINLVRLLGPDFYRVDTQIDCTMDETQNLDKFLLEPADALDLTAALDFLANW